jgi:Domain of unknown function (DUF4410)
MRNNYGSKYIACLLFCALIAFVTQACGEVQHTSELEAGYVPKADTRIEVGPITNETGKSFDVDIQQMFSDALTQQLQEDNLLWSASQGDHLIITTKVVEYEPGNAFKRWLLPGYGSTVLGLHCELKDSVSGNLVGSADARRTVSFGGAYTIGAWKSVFANTAKDVVGELRKQINNAGAPSEARRIMAGQRERG